MPRLTIILVLILSGLISGSFINLMTYRLPRNENWITGRSKCPSCQHQLSACDLVPLIAPLLLLLAYMQAPYLDWAFWKLAIFYLVCLTIFFTDLETTIIPDELSLGLVGLGLGSRLITGGLLDGIWGAVVGFGVYFMIGVVSKLIYKKDAMGGGDIKLGAGIGAMWGLWMTVYTVYLSFIIGAIVGLFLIVCKQKARQDYIPFGPMIVVAAMMVLGFWY